MSSKRKHTGTLTTHFPVSKRGRFGSSSAITDSLAQAGYTLANLTSSQVVQSMPNARSSRKRKSRASLAKGVSRGGKGRFKKSRRAGSRKRVRLNPSGRKGSRRWTKRAKKSLSADPTRRYYVEYRGSTGDSTVFNNALVHTLTPILNSITDVQAIIIRTQSTAVSALTGLSNIQPVSFMLKSSFSCIGTNVCNAPMIVEIWPCIPKVSGPNSPGTLFLAMDSAAQNLGGSGVATAATFDGGRPYISPWQCPALIAAYKVKKGSRFVVDPGKAFEYQYDQRWTKIDIPKWQNAEYTSGSAGTVQMPNHSVHFLVRQRTIPVASSAASSEAVGGFMTGKIAWLAVEQYKYKVCTPVVSQILFDGGYIGNALAAAADAEVMNDAQDEKKAYEFA